MTRPVPAAPAGPPATAAIEWRRVSPRMLLVHPVVEVARALPALVGVLFAGGRSHGALFSLVAAGIVAVLSILRWFTTRFRITPTQIQLRRGLLGRRTVTAGLDRVRTVDVTSHALHRVLGLSRVTIGTGMSDRKNQHGLRLDGLDAAEATRLRARLLHRGVDPLTASDPPPEAGAGAWKQPPERTIVALVPSWVRYAPFTTSGALTGLAILGIAWRIINESHVNPSKLALTRWLTGHLDDTPVWLDVLQGVVATVVVISMFSTVGYVLAFWHFRLTRHEEGSLHVSRGLITTRSTSIEDRRLVGVELVEPLLVRAVGGARCTAVATGLRVGRGAERGGEVLLPPAPRAVAERVCGEVLRRADAATAALVPHGPKARHRRYTRGLAGAAVLATAVSVVAGLAGAGGWYWAITPVAVLLALPLAADRARSLGHLVDAGLLSARLGSLSRRRTMLSTDAIIGWTVRRSLFQRRAGLATLVATTAAGRQRYAVVDVEVAEAIRLADLAVPGLLDQLVRR